MEFRYRSLFDETRAMVQAAPERRRVNVSAESRQVSGFETRVRRMTIITGSTSH